MSRLNRNRSIKRITCVGIATLLASITPAMAVWPETQVVAVTDDVTPDGSSKFISFDGQYSPPALNGGFAVFGSTVTASGGTEVDHGVYRWDGTSLGEVVRAGQPTPLSGRSWDSSFVISTSGPFLWPSVTENGEVSVLGQTVPGSSGPGAPLATEAVGWDGETFTQIYEAGTLSPDGRDTVAFTIGMVTGGTNQGVYHAILEAGGEAMIAWNGASQVQIARTGQTMPEGVGTIHSFGTQDANEVGQVAFGVVYSQPDGATDFGSGFVRWDGSWMTEIARQGQPFDDATIGRVYSGASGGMNNAGQVAMRVDLHGVGGVVDSSLLVGDGATFTQIAREGDNAPDGNGTLGEISFSSFDLNDAGQVAFRTALTTAEGETEYGIFRGDGSELTQVVRTGQAAPDGNGVFGDFTGAVMNESGQIMFGAEFDSATDDMGLYLFDDNLGILQIARTGEDFLGSTISRIGHAGQESLQFANDSFNGLNDLGQLAFQFELADGREGIAISTATEPSLACDFDADGDCDQGDIDILYAQSPTNTDIVSWLVQASSPSNPFKAEAQDLYVLGDVNLDGQVDSTDLGLLLNNFGDATRLNWSNGNLNADSSVDSTDLGILLNNFGSHSAAASAVPESAPPMIVWGWVLLCLRRMVRRSVKVAS